MFIIIVHRIRYDYIAYNVHVGDSFCPRPRHLVTTTPSRSFYYIIKVSYYYSIRSPIAPSQKPRQSINSKFHMAQVRLIHPLDAQQEGIYKKKMLAHDCSVRSLVIQRVYSKNYRKSIYFLNVQGTSYLSALRKVFSKTAFLMV